MKIVIILLGIIVIIVAGAIFSDLASTPTPKKGQCLLVRRNFLPDYCANACNPPFDCTSQTRPYGIVFTQAAKCADAVICQ